MRFRLVLRALAPVGLVVGALVGSSPAHAATIQVTSLSDTPSASTCTLRKAIDAATTNSIPAVSNCTAGQADAVDIIRLDVLDGDYLLSGTGDDSNAAGDLDIPDAGGPLQIRGDLDGNGKPLDRINGSGTDRVIDIRSSYPVSLINLTIEGGRHSEGAGIMIQQFTNVTLDHVVVSGNSTNLENSVGAGINALYGSTVTITDSTIGGVSSIDANVARIGGGIFSQANLTITRTQVIGNHATVPSNGALSKLVGGGMAVSGGSAVVNNSVISQNTVIANEASDTLSGAGIAVENAALSLNNSTVSGNVLEAAGSHATGSGLLVTGGMVSTVSVTNSTIANNVIQSGGGTRTWSAVGFAAGTGSSLALDHVTVSGNAPAASAISADPAITARGSIFNEGLAACSGAPITADAFNWDAGTSCVGATDDADAENGTGLNLGPLNPNGGFGQTMALAAGSSAIDLEPTTSCHDIAGGSLTADQRGVGRPFGAGCDAGAFELASCQGQAPTIVQSGVISGTSGADVIAGSGGADTIDPGSGADIVCASSGNDTVAANDGVADTIDCGPGTDSYRADAADILIGCEINLSQNGNDGGGGGGTTSTCGGRPVTIPGTPASETLTGTPGADIIAAGDGNDIVLGLGGNDIVCGGNGDDVLKGGSGNDKLFGEAGKDALKGGGGTKDVCNGGLAKDVAKKCERVRQL